MKLLVVADSYVTCSVFVGVFDSLSVQHEIRYAEVDESSTFSPSTPSELRVHEYLGTPAELVRLLDGDDVLIVHGAPVTDAVLDASPSLRLVGMRAGGTRERRPRGGQFARNCGGDGPGPKRRCGR